MARLNNCIDDLAMIFATLNAILLLTEDAWGTFQILGKAGRELFDGMLQAPDPLNASALVNQVPAIPCHSYSLSA